MFCEFWQFQKDFNPFFVFFVDIYKKSIYNRENKGGENLIAYGNPLHLTDCTLLYLGSWQSKNSGAYVEEHLHGNFFEFTSITRGKGKIYTGSNETAVSTGDIYISFPFEIHKIESDTDSPLGYDFISLRVDSMHLSEKYNTLWSKNISPFARVVSGEKTSKILSQIIEEAECDSKLFHSELLSSLCTQMLIYVLRDFSSIDKNMCDTVASNSELCHKLVCYIDSHIYTMNNLSELSEVFGYNYSYLSSTFRKNTTCSLSYYFKAKKLETARMIMEEKNMSISRVAEMMNYSSIYSFSKAFTKHYGISPRKYLSQRTSGKNK